jgi:NAD(P)-dependent dehydrogenase (short-subunit alcohol dehydrogenase family)
MTQSVGRVMQGQGSGVIVNLITAKQDPVKNEAAFIASMQGLAAFTRQAAHELNPHGIRVYAVENAGEKTIEAVLALLEER